MQGEKLTAPKNANRKTYEDGYRDGYRDGLRDSQAPWQQPAIQPQLIINRGCVCPAGAEFGCVSSGCPRRSILGPIVTCTTQGGGDGR